MRVQLNFMGSLEVLVEGAPVTRFQTGKVRALLAYLTLEAREHSREALAASGWSWRNGWQPRAPARWS